jgi:hypothetical protein
MHSLDFRKGCYTGNEVISKTVATNAIRRHLCVLQTRFDELAAHFPVNVGDIIFDADGEAVGEITTAPVINSDRKDRREDADDDIMQSLSELVACKGLCLGLVKTKLSSPGTDLRVKPQKLIDDDSSSDYGSGGSGGSIALKVLPSPYPRFDPYAHSPAPPVEKQASKGKQVIVSPDLLTKGSQTVDASTSTPGTGSPNTPPAASVTNSDSTVDTIDAIEAAAKAEAERKAKKMEAMAAKVAALKKKKKG